MRAVKAAKLEISLIYAFESAERKSWGSLGSGPGVGLDVNAPDLGVEVECLECTLSAEVLELVDPLVRFSTGHLAH